MWGRERYLSDKSVLNQTSEVQKISPVGRVYSASIVGNPQSFVSLQHTLSAELNLSVVLPPVLCSVT